MSGRRGGIPGPESRTGLVRPSMSEAEFERRHSSAAPVGEPGEPEPTLDEADAAAPRGLAAAPAPAPTATRTRTRTRAVKPRRVQRMFAIEEELDKKLWLYAIHVGKDRSEVINDLLRPIVASMVLYDSRDRRSSSRTSADAPEPATDGQGG